MANVTISPLARSDLRYIWIYGADKWGRQKADAYLRDINTLITKVAHNPNRGRACDSIRKGYAKISFGSHTIFYRRVDGGIDVKRILHQAMYFSRHL
jgi:toxin ParE1/3/4